ncbi:MAG: TonB family protein [Pyrinomonadaceae bacterium]
MKNLSGLLPAVLLVLFAGIACKNIPFAEKDSTPRNSETPFSNRTPPPETSKETLNETATSLPKPVYPKAAKAVRASGEVKVEVEVDEKGNVTSAKSVSGHPLLRQAAEQAAKQAKFKPSAEKVNGVIVYNFTAE